MDMNPHHELFTSRHTFEDISIQDKCEMIYFSFSALRILDPSDLKFGGP